jgi:type IV secretory pathway VirB10-like protein
MRTPIVEQIFGSNKAPLATVLDADFEDLQAEVAAAVDRAKALPTTIKTEAQLAEVGNCIADLRGLAKKIDGTRMDEGRPLLDAQRGINDFFKTLGNQLEDVSKPLQRAADDHAKRKAAEERARREREAAEARRKEEEARRKAEQAKSDAAAARAEGQAEAAAARAERAEQAASASAAELVRTRAFGVTSSAKTVWDFTINDYQALTASMGPLGPFIDRSSVEKAIRSVVRIQKGTTSLPGVEVFEDVRSTFRR